RRARSCPPWSQRCHTTAPERTGSWATHRAPGAAWILSSMLSRASPLPKEWGTSNILALTAPSGILRENEKNISPVYTLLGPQTTATYPTRTHGRARSEHGRVEALSASKAPGSPPPRSGASRKTPAALPAAQPRAHCRSTDPGARRDLHSDRRAR